MIVSVTNVETPLGADRLARLAWPRLGSFRNFDLQTPEVLGYYTKGLSMTMVMIVVVIELNFPNFVLGVLVLATVLRQGRHK